MGQEFSTRRDWSTPSFLFGEGDRITLQGQSYSLGSSGDGDVLPLLSGSGSIELNGISQAGFQAGFVV